MFAKVETLRAHLWCVYYKVSIHFFSLDWYSGHNTFCVLSMNKEHHYHLSNISVLTRYSVLHTVKIVLSGFVLTIVVICTNYQLTAPWSFESSRNQSFESEVLINKVILFISLISHILIINMINMSINMVSTAMKHSYFIHTPVSTDCLVL